MNQEQSEIASDTLRELSYELGLPDGVGNWHAHNERLRQICEDVRSKGQINGPLIMFSSDGDPTKTMTHPELARELSKPENAGALEALRAIAKLPTPKSTWSRLWGRFMKH